jgi:hypothetical protein
MQEYAWTWHSNRPDKNDRIVEEAWRRDLGDPDVSDWMFGVGDIDFVHARSGPTNTRADQWAAAVGTVTVPEPGVTESEGPGRVIRNYP